MSYVKADVICSAIREVLTGSAGYRFAIPSGSYLGSLPLNADAETENYLSAQGVRIEPVITGISRHPSSPPWGGSIQLWSIDCEVRAVRFLDQPTQVTDELKDAGKGLAIRDADVMAQVMCYPHNLTSASNGSTTDLVSGRLDHVGSKVRFEGTVNEGAQRIVTVHQFKGVAKSYPGA